MMHASITNGCTHYLMAFLLSLLLWSLQYFTAIYQRMWMICKLDCLDRIMDKSYDGESKYLSKLNLTEWHWKGGSCSSMPLNKFTPISSNSSRDTTCLSSYERTIEMKSQNQNRIHIENIKRSSCEVESVSPDLKKIHLAILDYGKNKKYIHLIHASIFLLFRWNAMLNAYVFVSCSFKAGFCVVIKASLVWLGPICV